jgi:hypothetical protein
MKKVSYGQPNPREKAQMDRLLLVRKENNEHISPRNRAKGNLILLKNKGNNGKLDKRAQLDKNSLA